MNHTYNAVYEGNFEVGIEAIGMGQETPKPLYPESNAIALHLDREMLNHYAGHYAGEDFEDIYINGDWFYIWWNHIAEAQAPLP